MILLFFAKERLFSFGLQNCFDSSITCSKFRLGFIIYQSTYGSVILPDELEMSEIVKQMIAEDKHKRWAAFHTLILNPTTQKNKYDKQQNTKKCCRPIGRQAKQTHKNKSKNTSTQNMQKTKLIIIFVGCFPATTVHFAYYFHKL